MNKETNTQKNNNRIKIFTEFYVGELENKINKFLIRNDIKIIDIKYWGKTSNTQHTAIIVYSLNDITVKDVDLT